MRLLPLFLLSTSMLFGCAKAVTNTVYPPQALIDSRWVVVEPSSLLQAGKPPRLQFTGLTQVGGFAGCNQFGGAVAIKGVSIRFGPMALTKMMCPPPAMAVERDFVKSLGEVDHAVITDYRMALINAKGDVVMVLTPVSAP